MNTASASSSDAANQQAVHLAIYDLSQGMARTLSSQFLGAQHAVDIIPHTALVVFGKEYYFGMGIQSCSPHEFRNSRGIHPIEIQLLGLPPSSKLGVMNKPQMANLMHQHTIFFTRIAIISLRRRPNQDWD